MICVTLIEEYFGGEGTWGIHMEMLSSVRLFEEIMLEFKETNV